MKKFFYLLFSTIILISCGNGAKAKTEAQSMEEKQPDHIEVLYFHGAQRCITCRAIETNIVALLDSLYSKEQADDRIIYKVIDISKKENGQSMRPIIHANISIRWASSWMKSRTMELCGKKS